ncbi:MAG: phage distal tail protein, Rcc01695 family [Pseudomonadota bacterium]
MYWLTAPEDALRRTFIKRFDPRFWTVNFPRPMMASVITQGSDALRVDLTFYERDNLAGLIWDSVDTLDPPHLRYETARDYSGTVLRFRWRAGGIRGLAEVNGPTLTIEGRDASGAPRTWYVRLWNYAVGATDDALITLDFSQMDGGFLLPQEADPLWPGDIDRMFISMVPPDFDGVATGPLANGAAEAWVEISAMAAEGPLSTIGLGDAFTPPHPLRLANGYDDVFNQTPERLLRNALHLGYQGALDHYAGMSHYFRLAFDAGESRFIAARDGNGSVLNAPCRAWHQDYFARAAALGYEVILSLSFELFDAWAPASWKQRAFDASPALTGWQPPSTLLTPTNDTAMDYLADAFLEFTGVQAAAGLLPAVQIGEPWWWVASDASAKPCFYDATTTALYTAETGQAVPPAHQSVTETPDAAQQAYLDWLGTKLGAATLALRDAVQGAYPGAKVFLLVYTPQVLRTDAPMLASVNMPASWSFPAFTRLQVEDYDHVIAGDWRAHAAGLAQVAARFGYSPQDSDYFAGFVLDPADGALWRNIARAIEDGRARGFAEVFVWAYPQVARDGFVFFQLEDDDMTGFHEVRFPVDIAFGATGGPVFSTTVSEMVSGAEQRNINWAQARARYDVGGGLRGEADLAQLIAFFRARQGRAHGFRFKDWADFSSASVGTSVSASDQVLGAGDGLATSFQLVKHYGDLGADVVRPILKPVAGTVRVALDGVELTSGWVVDTTTGVLDFENPPVSGAQITAGFEFDVPVRFAEDSLAVSFETFAAGEVPSIPLVEIRL